MPVWNKPNPKPSYSGSSSSSSGGTSNPNTNNNTPNNSNNNGQSSPPSSSSNSQFNIRRNSNQFNNNNTSSMYHHRTNQYHHRSNHHTSSRPNHHHRDYNNHRKPYYHHSGNSSSRQYERSNSGRMNSSGTGVSGSGSGHRDHHHSPIDRAGSGTISNSNSMNDDKMTMTNVNDNSMHTISTNNNSNSSTTVVEEGEIAISSPVPTTSASNSTANLPTGLSFQPPMSSSSSSSTYHTPVAPSTSSSKFIPPSSLKRNKFANSHEEGEIQPATTTSSSQHRHTHSNTNSNKHTWIPPPGASSNTATTIGGGSLNNNNNSTPVTANNEKGEQGVHRSYSMPPSGSTNNMLLSSSHRRRNSTGGRDVSGNNTNITDNNEGNNDHSYGSIRKKIFQPPPGKEKSTHFNPSPPQSHGKAIDNITVKRSMSLDTSGKKQFSDPRWKPASSSSTTSSTTSNSDFGVTQLKSSTFIPAKDRLNKIMDPPRADYTTSSSTSIVTSANHEAIAQSPEIPPVPLTCAALGNSNDISQASKLIKKLDDLVSDVNLNVDTSALNTIPLPHTYLIHSGIKTLESEIEKLTKECKQIKVSHQLSEEKQKQEIIANSTSVKEEDAVGTEDTSKDGEVSIDNLIAEATTTLEKEKVAKEDLLKEEIIKMQQYILNLEQDVEALILKGKEARLENERLSIEAEINKEKLENDKIIEMLEDDCNKAKVAFDASEKIIELSGQSLENAKLPQSAVMKEFKMSEDTAVQEAVPQYDPPESEASVVVPDSLTERLQNIMAITRDDPEKMTDLIMSIYQENHQTAETAHESALSVLPCTLNLESKSPLLIPEQPVDVTDDDALNQYFEHWSTLTRQVTGPGDALYTEPSESPLYENNEIKHESVKLLVKEHIRSKTIKLHSRWVELAEEYAVRQEKYSKETTITSSSFTSADIANLPILSGGEYNPDASGGRSTANPYRRARRGVVSGMGGSDIVRSEYEQQQIIAQLEAKANMERRIKLGGSELPRQKCELEKDMCAAYIDTMSSRRVHDPLEEAHEQKHKNPWSDVEKCIFLDRFLQHPKDFRKIASFLKNKSVHDCISFYYDSKQSVPYKRALKEHFKRKKRSFDAVKWDATIQAAISVGATVRMGISSEKPLIFDLPQDDLTFHTRHFHPLGKEVFDVVCGGNYPSIEISSIQDVKKLPHKRKASAMLDLFTLDTSERKFLRAYSDGSGKNSASGSDLEQEKDIQGSNSPTVNSDRAPVEKRKKRSHKWSNEEKAMFFEAFELVGKKWAKIADVIKSKSALQVKKFYQENKKQINKSKSPTKGKRDTTQSSADISISNDGSNANLEQKDNRRVKHGFTQESMQEAQETSGNSSQGQSERWFHNDNQQRQLAYALEQHRQQQLVEQQQRHLLNQLSQNRNQQQLLDFQLQQQEQQHRQLNEHHIQLQQQRQIQNLLNQGQGGHQNMMASWVAAQVAQAAMRQDVRHQQSLQDYLGLEGGNNFQNIAMALQQASQQQNGFQLGVNSNSNNSNQDNDGGQNQQTSDLSLLAQLASNRNNQDNQNR